MGTQGLEKIKPLLRDFNKWLESPSFQKFKEAGTKAFAGLFESATETVRKVANYLDTHFFSNPEFQKITTIEGKIKFVFEDIMATFNKWWDASGKAKIENIAKNLVDTLTTIIKDSDKLIAAAVDIGVAIGEGLLKGILSVKTLTTLLGLESLSDKYSDFAPDKYDNFTPKTTFTYGYANKNNIPKDKHVSGTTSGGASFIGSVGGFAGGLDRVPYNGFPARLHRDEMVLTRTEAQEYREGRSGRRGSGDRPFTIHIANMHVRNDEDIDKIATKLAHVLAQ